MQRYRTRLRFITGSDYLGTDSLPTRYYLARAQLKLALSQSRGDDRDRALASYQAAIDLTGELAIDRPPGRGR